MGQTPVTPTEPPSHPVFPTGTGTPLGAQIAALLNEPSVIRAHWGIAVTALDGTPIYGLDEGKLFRPASNAKLYTTAAAMALLGPDATVTTKVFGELDANGTVRGDLSWWARGMRTWRAMICRMCRRRSGRKGRSRSRLRWMICVRWRTSLWRRA